MPTDSFQTTAENAYVPAAVVEFEDERKAAVCAFWITKRPITVGQYLEFSDATGYVTTAEREGDVKTFKHNELTEDLGETQALHTSAVFISKKDAEAYCAWSQTRLPTEEEWLAAAILDWDPLAQGVKISDAMTAEMQDRKLIYAGAEWVSSVDAATGMAVLRSAPTYFLKPNWRSLGGRRTVQSEYYGIELSFRAVITPPEV